MKQRFKTLKKIVSMYLKKSGKHDIFGLCAEMGFYLLNTLFPFVLLLFVIATNISDRMQGLLLNLIEVLPKDMEAMIEELLTSFRGSMPIIITASVLALWCTSNVISTLTKALNRFYGVKETRSFLKQRGMFLLYAVAIIILIVLSFALIIFGEGTQYLFKDIDLLSFFHIEKVWNYSRYISLILVIFTAITIMFKHLPNKQLSIKAVAAGGALTTIAWCITSIGFSFYVNSFGRYHLIYGSLTSIIILTTWVYLSSFVILLGGSINAFWYRMRVAKKLNKVRKLDLEEPM